ncbi:MAG: peptidoglycan-binding domain-containing protein [Chthoniobacterales bacterium]
MGRKFICQLLVAALFCGATARAEEPLRQVQEELRKRNHFYGDINGRQSSTLTNALKLFQERKGFPQPARSTR